MENSHSLATPSVWLAVRRCNKAIWLVRCTSPSSWPYFLSNCPVFFGTVWSALFAPDCKYKKKINTSATTIEYAQFTSTQSVCGRLRRIRRHFFPFAIVRSHRAGHSLVGRFQSFYLEMDGSSRATNSKDSWIRVRFHCGSRHGDRVRYNSSSRSEKSASFSTWWPNSAQLLAYCRIKRGTAREWNPPNGFHDAFHLSAKFRTMIWSPAGAK